MALGEPAESVDTADTPRGDLYTTEGLRRLLSLPGIGPTRARGLAEAFSNWSRLLDADPGELADALHDNTNKIAGSALAAARTAPTPAPLPDGVRAIGCFDSEWPTWLDHPPLKPPAVIFVRGSLPEGRTVGIVGTRSPTRFGLKVVEEFVASASNHRIGIISGLALGIDGEAHRAALSHDLPTWAILGGGVDTPTPREHVGLAERIVEAGGGLLSELEPGTQPNPQRLVARNRLQAAASTEGLVVAQCAVPSGTLHTARFALELGCRLIVPKPRPGFEDEPESRGNMILTDTAGCRAEWLSAKGALARIIESRHPVADVVIEDRSEIEGIWG